MAVGLVEDQPGTPIDDITKGDSAFSHSRFLRHVVGSDNEPILVSHSLKQGPTVFYAKFKINEVEKIYDHSVKHPVYTPSFSEMFEAKHRKDGKDFASSPGKWPKADDVDVSTLDERCWLVKDRGAYLMAATVERLKGEKEHNFVAYCEGCDPDVDEDVFDRCRAVFGGDDFSEVIPLDWLALAIEDAKATGIDCMIIKVTKNNLALVRANRTPSRGK